MTSSSLSEIFGQGPAPHPDEHNAARWEAKPGEQVHFLEDGLVIHTHADSFVMASGYVTERGQVVTLTDDLLRSNPGVFEIANDPEAQQRKWKRQLLGAGDWPEGEPLFIPGTVKADLEANRRRALAHRIADEDERNAELRRITREFGRPRNRQTLSYYGPDGGNR